MTQAAGPDLKKGRSAAALTPQARQVHRAVLAAFAENGPGTEAGRPDRPRRCHRRRRGHGAGRTRRP